MTMQHSEALDSDDALEFGSFQQAAAHHLGHPIKPYSQLASIVDAWAEAMPPSTRTNDDFDTHGSVLANLCRDLRPPETMPDGTTPSHWPGMPSRPVDHFVWPWPWLALGDKTVTLAPATELEGDIQAFLSLGLRLPSLEAMLLHACLYKQTVNATWRAEMGPDAWWRRSIQSTSSVTGYRWWELKFHTLRSRRARAKALGELWPIIPAAIIVALLWSIEWRVALAAGVTSVGIGRLVQATLSARDKAGMIFEAIESMAHVCVLARQDSHLGGSAHAVREQMYRTETMGADWPGIAYRLVERLIADESIKAGAR